MDLLYLAAIWGGAVTAVFLPLFCIADVKERHITDNAVIAYMIAGSPTGALYLFGLPLTYLGLSLIMCIAWIIIRKTGAWGGGDTKFLMVFSLICPLNPFNLYQQGFQVVFLLVLAVVMLAVALVTGNRKDLPLMLPIAAAVVIAMAAGVIL